MRFEQRIAVDAPPQRVWAFLWDVPRVAACIPGCREARAVEPPERYAAAIEQRVGQFKVRFDLDVRVLESREPTRVRVTASGRDRGTGSHLNGELAVTIEPAGGGSAIDIAADVSVLGKLGGLGYAVIKRRSEQVIEEFAEALREGLGAAGGAGTGA